MDDEVDLPPNDPPVRREPPERTVVQPTEAHVALTAALRTADRIVHQGEAVRLQLVLTQFERAVLDDEAAGRAVHHGGALERAFTAHLAGELHCSRQAADLLLDRGLALRDALPRTMAVFVEGGCSQVQALLVAAHVDGLDDAQVALLDRAASECVGDHAPAALERRLEALRARLAPERAIDDARVAAGARCVSAVRSAGAWAR